MDRRLLLLVVAVVALVGVVNATVYAYRWMTGTVNIAGPGQATGAACTGFYSSANQSGIESFLPKVGTNYDAYTYGSNRILVTPGNIVCTFDSYKLYESIEVEIPITVGSWYIQDFYGFGFKNESGYPVYVYFRVEQAATGLSTAYLKIYKSGSLVASLDLTNSGVQTSAITLNPNEALRLDLHINSTSTGTVSFTVGVYVTQEYGESPSP